MGRSEQENPLGGTMGLGEFEADFFGPEGSSDSFADAEIGSQDDGIGLPDTDSLMPNLSADPSPSSDLADGSGALVSGDGQISLLSDLSAAGADGLYGIGDQADLPLVQVSLHSDTGGQLLSTGSALPSAAPMMSTITAHEEDMHEEDMGDMTGGSMGGGHDHEGAAPAIAPPGPHATAAEIDAYVDAVKAQPETHAHDDNPGKMTEHMAAMELVARDEATHVAVSDGDWFSPSTWHNGIIPGDGAKVLIPEGIDVHYEGVSDARLLTVRVDGALHFATDADSRMVFDTTVVSPTGALIVGTEADPVDADVTVELIVANNGAIDTNWDPMLLSRGIIAHGSASIHGAEVDSHEKVAKDPMAGSKVLEFDSIPDGWKVGDTLVIAGTTYEGHKWSHAAQASVPYPSEDEVRTIKAINGTKVILDKALDFDHDTPRADLKTSVANMTRNVVIETENGDTAQVHERGHVMFMHSDDVDVRYAAFNDLGRTDKSAPSFDISDFDPPQYDSNVQGRYSLHLHKTGTTDIDHPVNIVGNAVWGSPGWGYVQHDANANFDNNASFDTFGAGYVAETGNETGVWNDNIAIYAQGISWEIAKNSTTLSETEFDTARGGDGFWFQGRLITTTNNIASSVNTGFTYFHRNGDGRMLPVDPEHFEFPDALLYQSDIRADHVAILGFSGNETFAANMGLEIVKANPNQGHDVWSLLDDFTGWSVKTGARLEYTTHYILRDFDLIAKTPTLYSPPVTGIGLGKSTSEVVIIDSKIDGFVTGVDLKKLWTFGSFTPDQHQYVLIDTAITNAVTMYESYDPQLDRILTSADLPNLKPGLDLEPLVYVDGRVIISGTKSDTLGRTDFPGGSDGFDMKGDAVVTALEKDGYWKTSGGQAYFLIDIYFTDRVTGEIFHETHPVFLLESTVSKLGKISWQYSHAMYNGVQDFTEIAGQLYAGTHLLDSADEGIPVLGRGPNLLDGTDDADVIRGSRSADVVNGLGGKDEIRGRDGNDILTGHGGADSLYGGRGNDKAFGGDGADLLKGKSGNDILFGGKGHDRLFGNWQDDFLYGEDGNDMLSGGLGRDTMTGGAGDDIFYFGARHGRDKITDFKVGEDHIHLAFEGASFEDVVIKAVSDGTMISTGAGSIHLLRVDAADLSASDFMISTSTELWS